MYITLKAIAILSNIIGILVFFNLGFTKKNNEGQKLFKPEIYKILTNGKDNDIWYNLGFSLFISIVLYYILDTFRKKVIIVSLLLLLFPLIRGRSKINDPTYRKNLLIILGCLIIMVLHYFSYYSLNIIKHYQEHGFIISYLKPFFDDLLCLFKGDYSFSNINYEYLVSMTFLFKPYIDMSILISVATYLMKEEIIQMDYKRLFNLAVFPFSFPIIILVFLGFIQGFLRFMFAFFEAINLI